MTEPKHMKSSSSEFGRADICLFGRYCDSVNLYYIAFSIYMFINIIMRTRYGGVPAGAEGIWPTISRVLQACILVLLVAKGFIQSYTLRQIAVVALITILALLNRTVTHWNFLVWIAAFVICAQGVSIRTLAKITIIIWTPIIIITALLSCLGIIDNYTIFGVWGRSALSPEPMARYSLGFIHPTTFGLVCTAVCTALLVLAEKWRHPWVAVVLSLVVAVLVYLVTNSRGPVLTSVFAVVLFGLSRIKKPYISRTLVLLAGLVYAAMVCMTLVGSFFYSEKNPIMILLNKVSSNRFKFGNMLIEDGGLSLLGIGRDSWPHIEVDGVQQFSIDSAYMFAVASFGIIGIIILIIIAKLYVVAWKENWFGPALFGLSVFLVAGFTEQVPFMPFYNYYVIAFAALLYGKRLSVVDNGNWGHLKYNSNKIPTWIRILINKE